jgi:hypothetical protein
MDFFPLFLSELGSRLQDCVVNMEEAYTTKSVVQAASSERQLHDVKDLGYTSTNQRWYLHTSIKNCNIQFDRKSRPSGYHSWFMFGWSRVQIVVWKPAIMTEVLLGVPLSPENAGIVFQIKPWLLLSILSSIHYGLVIATQSELLKAPLNTPKYVHTYCTRINTIFMFESKLLHFATDIRLT